MNEDCNFYICSTCFSTSEEPRECHGEMMIHCGSFAPGDERLKPLMDSEGNLITSAPRWYLEKAKLQQGYGRDFFRHA